MNRKLAAAAGAVALVAAAVAVTAGTYSYFSDRQQFGGATLQSGTLSLQAQHNVSMPPIDLSHLRPGNTFTESMTLTNTGNTDGYLFGRMRAKVESPLGTLLRATVKVDGHEVWSEGSLRALVRDTAKTHQLGPLHAGQSRRYTIVVRWPNTNPDRLDNRGQGKTGTATFYFTLRQVNQAPS